LPAVSTIGEELRRQGLTRGRARRPVGPVVVWPVKRAVRRVHDVWTVDFKGSFCTGDGHRCEPLTVRDQYSRYGLCAKIVAGTQFILVQQEFKKLFRQHGLPRVIHTDQGVPFSRSGPALLARLSAWWVSLGIEMEFSRKARPGDNAAHEQWHRVMKSETANPPAHNRRAQQQRHGRWLRIYNEERPHEALGQRVPAQLYHPSPRRYQGVRPTDYPKRWEQRRVRRGGEIGWQGRRRFIGESFAGFMVGLKAAGPHHWQVYFYHLLLGELHQADTSGLRSAQYRRASSRT
jgi:putative transposase